jgi:MFS transporter, SP family, arabinose:H+ symporter
MITETIAPASKRTHGNRFSIWICLVAAIGGLLFGFDTAVISGALPYVVSDFGFNTFMEGWFVSSALLGCIIGVVCSGKLSDWKGRKFVMLLSAGLFLLSAVGCMLAASAFWLIAFRLAGGLGIGVASMICPLYISEISPPHRRGMMVALYQLAITAGIVAAYFSNAVLAGSDGANLTGFFRYVIVEDPWRSMIGFGLIPSVLFWIGLVFIPESPRWLLLKGRRKEAEKVLLHTNDGESAAAEIKMIEAGLRTEKTGLKQLFTRRYRTPLLVGLLLPFFAQVSGINAVIYYGPSILDKAGFSLGDALGGQVVIGLVNVVFTFVAIFTVDRWGRKPLLTLGISLAVLSLAVIGFLFQQNIVDGPWILLFILLFIASFAFSFGPVTFVVISEIFPTAVRAQAVSLGILSMWTANFFVGQLTPAMLKSESWGPAATFWTFALLCAPALYLTLKLIPETKGKTLEEIEALWSGRKRSPSKRLKSKLNAYES